MGGRAAAVAGLALALAVPTASVATGEQAAGSTTASSSADCVPVQHSKRVVKRVKIRKNGRVVKVKRKRTIRWETCEQQPSAPAGAVPAGGIPACAEPSTSLGVTARDNSAMPRYSLSRTCVTTGTVHVELENQGEDPHHLFVRPSGLPTGSPATYKIPDQSPFELEAWDGMGAPPTAGADIALTQGDWYLWCDLLLHEEQGMFATLQVR